MPWISRDKLDDLKREVNYAQTDTKIEQERKGEILAREKTLIKVIQDLSAIIPEVAALVEVDIHSYTYGGDFYYDLERSGLDDLLASRDRKRQDEFAAEFDKM